MFKIQNFEYNGLSVKTTLTLAPYTAEFKEWTSDPGIAKCKCNDGKERLIPSCALIGDKSFLPKQNYKNGKTIFGQPCTS